jgi:acetyl-CoA carboxylase biotin carboxylase subunit
MVTGRDLVVEQIRVAAGAPISFTQEDVALTGHAIECRINAEDAGANFAPRPGRLQTWVAPEGEGVRIDTHCFSGYLVPPYYDSLLAKIIVHGRDRNEAVARMQEALGSLRISGVPTTAPFHQQVLAHQDFAGAAVTTRWVEETFLPSVRQSGAA